MSGNSCIFATNLTKKYEYYCGDFMTMKRTRVIVLYIMCVLTLSSCADRQLGAVLDQAEQIMHSQP